MGCFMSEHERMLCTSEHGCGLNKLKNNLPLLKGNCIIWWFYLLLVTEILLKRIQRVIVSCIEKDNFFFQGVDRNLCHVLILVSGFCQCTCCSASLLLACLIAKSHFV